MILTSVYTLAFSLFSVIASLKQLYFPDMEDSVKFFCPEDFQVIGDRHSKTALPNSSSEELILNIINVSL